MFVNCHTIANFTNVMQILMLIRIKIIGKLACFVTVLWIEFWFIVILGNLTSLLSFFTENQGDALCIHSFTIFEVSATIRI